MTPPLRIDPTVLADGNVTMDDDTDDARITARAVALLDAAPRFWSSARDEDAVLCPARCENGMRTVFDSAFGSHALHCTALRTLAARTPADA